MWVFHLDLVDEINAEVAVHGLIAQDVLILLGRSGHFVLPTERQYLHEAHVKKHPFHDAGEHDQALQELLVIIHRAGLEFRIGQCVNKRQQEFVLVADARNLVIHVKNFAFIESQAFRDVLVSMSMDSLLKCLAQQILPAFRIGYMAVGAEHDIICGEAVGRDKKPQVALNDEFLVFGEAVRVPPQRDVAAHVDFLWHPIIGASGEIFFPGPFVFEWHQLVNISTTVNDVLVFD